MICMLKQLTAATLLFLFAAILASAQANVVGKCSGRVYKRSEVAKRAKIIDLPRTQRTSECFGAWDPCPVCNRRRVVSDRSGNGHSSQRGRVRRNRSIRDRGRFHDQVRTCRTQMAQRLTAIDVRDPDRPRRGNRPASRKCRHHRPPEIDDKRNLFMDQNSSWRFIQRGTAQARL